MCIKPILSLEASGNETCKINENLSVSVPGRSVEIHSHIECVVQVMWELLPRHGTVPCAYGLLFTVHVLLH